MSLNTTAQAKGNYVLFRDCVVHSGWLETPNTFFGDPTYELEVYIPEEIVDFIEENDINKQPSKVKSKMKKQAKRDVKDAYKYLDEYAEDYVVKFTCPAQWPSGDERKVKVTYQQGSPDEILGKGSVVDVIVYAVKNDSGKPRTIYMSEVLVKEFVESEIETSGGSSESGFSFDDFEE